MRMPVKHQVCALYTTGRRDVHQVCSQTLSFEGADERPFEVGIAVAAYDGHSRPNCTDFVQNERMANVSEMPDFIGIGDQTAQIRRNSVVSV